MKFHPNRRTFLQSSVATAAACAAPTLLQANPVQNANESIIGEGEYQFRVNHHHCQLPDKYTWQTTHNVAVDSSNQLYVIHEGHRDKKDHPSIFVFDSSGKFIRAFGCQFQGGGHGIEVRQEGSEEFLYVAGYQQVKSFAKMTLTGETVWFKKAPMESGIYADGEDISTEATWNRKGFLPTNFAFLEDGGFLLADGYGTWCIHRYDKDANWVSHFGGAGDGEGKFSLPHGLWIDRRHEGEPKVVVTDRSHDTVQILKMNGEHIETLTGYGKPANIDIKDDLMLIPELKARITLLDKENQVVARLGNDVAQSTATEKLREKPERWKDGQFVHPHDACFDAEGNIFVAEWVQTGRVTKMTRV